MNDKKIFCVATLIWIIFPGTTFADAQQPNRVPVIGFLSDAAIPEVPPAPTVAAFKEGLRELGYVEGKNISIEVRYTGRNPERLTESAAEFAHMKVDVIVTESGTGAIHAKEATKTIPIVMGGSGNPVGQGLVASLERPGGNVTGMTDRAPDLMARRLLLLRDVVPNLKRVGFLWPGPGYPTTDQEATDIQAAGRQLDIQVHLLKIRGADDLVEAFDTATRQNVQAVVVASLPNLIIRSGSRLADQAVSHRIPVVSHIPRYPRTGGLMSYGADPFYYMRQSAVYVDRILKGANPAELPVEGPKKIIWVVNLKAAKAIGLDIPASILSKADEVIQ